MPRITEAVRLVSVALCASSLLLGVSASAQAAPGDLDPSFGAGGLVTTDFGSRGDFSLAVALQTDGKIVAAGNSSRADVFDVDFALARYNSNGSLDATFGSGGTVLTDFGTSVDAASDVVVQPDGKILAAGIRAGDFALARYNADGSLDAAFGSAGKVTTDFGSFDQANAVAVQSDGKIVAAGGTAGGFALARYNSDGSLDAGFGSGGKVVGSLPVFVFDVAMTRDAKILVAGGSGFFPFGSSDLTLARYGSDGALDTGFGSGGTVVTDFGGSDNAFAIALYPDGRIVAAGGTKTSPSSGDFALARFNPAGSLDATFGTGGRVLTDFSSGSDDTAFGVVVHPDGGITAAGFTGPATGSSFALARYTSSGTLDVGFGSGGKVTTTFGHSTNGAFDIAAQPDGKVVAAGSTSVFGSSADFALARYLGAPTTITVAVDVKPDSADNVVPLQSGGVVPVAILTTDSFDATTVDPASVCFGGADDPGARACVEKHHTGHLEDANGDGRTDLLLHYDVAQTGIDPGDTEACLTGRTYAGVAIAGCDRISTK